MTPAGRKLDQFLSRSVKALKVHPMAGGKFFALIDEMKASEQRLDALAEPLLEKMATAEKEAAVAVESRHATLDAARDYIRRMQHTSDALGDGGNGGPSLPEPSSERSEQQPHSPDQQKA